jgi:membrane protease YdiL (CAAX protease family)
VIGLSIVVIPLSGLITTLLLTLLHLPLENPQLPALIPEGLDLGGALAMFLLVGLVVPVAEEIFFRGVIYNFLRARLGVWVAILFSSLIFAIAHGDLAVGTSAFVIGIAIAWVYEKSGSLWTAILIHAANNGVKIILLYIFVLLKLIPT